MHNIEINQDKVFLFIENLSIFVHFCILVVSISLFYHHILLTLLLVLVNILMVFPILFCYPKKIVSKNINIIIITKIKKYELSKNDIISIRKARARGGIAYKIKIKKFFWKFYLHSRSFDYDKLIKFINNL